MADGEKSPGPFKELGSSGLKRSSGLPQEEFLPQLMGDRWLKVIRQMSDNDSTVGSILFAIDKLMASSEWSTEPPDDAVEDPVAAEQAEFADTCLHDMSTSWHDTLGETQTMLPHGWALQEIVYKRRAGGTETDPAHLRSKFEDNRIGWRKLPLRAQDTRFAWKFDENGGIEGMWQQAPPTYRPEFIPIQRALLFRTTTAKNNPEGKSILRTAWQDWYFKKRIQMIEGTGIERDLAGLPLAYVPWRILTDQATPEEDKMLSEIKKILRNIRRDDQEGVVWPNKFDGEGNKLYELELLSTGGSRQFNTDEIVTRYDQRIAMSVLADFILLGHTKIGTQALSVSKIELFMNALKGWMDSIAGVYTRFALPRLMRINGMNEKLAPKLVYKQLKHVDLEELAAYLAELGNAGMQLFPDENLEAYVRDVADLPPASEETKARRELLDEDEDEESGGDLAGEGEQPDEEDME